MSDTADNALTGDAPAAPEPDAPEPTTHAAPAPDHADTPADGDDGDNADPSEPPEKTFPRKLVHHRIGQLSEERNTARQEAAQLRERSIQLEAELARYRQQPAPPGDQTQQQGQQPTQPAQPRPATTTDPMALAQQIANEQRFNEKANAVFESGVTKYPDFEDTVKSFQLIGGMNRQFAEAVSDLPNGADIIAHVGADLTAAQKLFAMPPARMGMELARISGELSKKPAVSKVPPPQKAVGGSARGSVDLEHMSMRDFDKEMAKREAAYRASRA